MTTTGVPRPHSVCPGENLCCRLSKQTQDRIWEFFFKEYTYILYENVYLLHV